MADKMSLVPDGLIIMFEGLDGVGKSTQLKLAAAELKQQQWLVNATRNLGGTPIGEALRATVLSPIERPPATDFYVSLGIQEALIPELEREREAGAIILMDRGPLSLAAYQIYGSGFDEATGWRAVDDGMQSIHPELVIQFKGDVTTSVKRAQDASGSADYFESKPLGFFERVAQGYEIASDRYPVEVLEASGTVDEVHQAVMRLIDRALQSKLSADD